MKTHLIDEGRTERSTVVTHLRLHLTKLHVFLCTVKREYVCVSLYSTVPVCANVFVYKTPEVMHASQNNIQNNKATKPISSDIA